MKEYYIENNKKIKLRNLEAGFMDSVEYQSAHEQLIITCHDVFIEYGKGFLLVNRDNFPAKDVLWPIGGRALRGVSFEDSLKEKVKEECGLDIINLQYLGSARTLFKTDPFGHKKGTDTFNAIYYAKGEGILSLDKLHSKSIIVAASNYSKLYKDKLHPYVKDFLEKAMLKSELNFKN